PALAPDGEESRSGERPTASTSPTPGGEAVAQSPAQTSERLKQVEERRQQRYSDATGSRRSGGRSGRARKRLHERCGDCQRQHGLRPTVSLLLFPVSDHRVAAVVPDDRCRAEPERPALLLDLPADFEVVSGHPELWIEASDRFQRRPSKGHVATG